MEYQPLSEQFSSAIPHHGHSPNQLSQRRCKSASCATASNASGIQAEPECISLPGQLNLDLDVGGIKQSAEFLANPSNCGALVPDDFEEELALREMDVAGETPEIKEQHDLTDCSRAQQTPLRECMYMEIEQSSAIETESQVNDDQEVRLESSQYSITSAVSTDITKLDDMKSYSSVLSLMHASSANVAANSYPENSQSNTPPSRVRTKPLTLVLYLLCAIVVYPLLLALVPFLLIFKLATLLCCCIPCCRHKRRKTPTAFKQQQLPLFFTSHPGGYHTIGVELQEQMDSETFVEYVISKLNNVYCHNSSMKQNIVYRLALVIQQIVCFSWWELGQNVRLEEHIQIVQKRITTTTNFTDFIEQISRNQRTIGQRKKLWRVYFFPFFKTNGSLVSLQIHNSLLSGVDLKDVLLGNFSDSSLSSRNKVKINAFSHPTVAETALSAPGVMLKHLLRSVFNFHRLSKSYRFVYSSPMHLSEALEIASHSGISLHALFMAPLSQCLRELFSQKYSSSSVRVAIPVNCSQCRRTTTFFVTLPLTSQTWDTTKLQSLDREILYNSKDSYILLSAAKFASFAFYPCTVDFLASSTLRQADILFNVVHCPNDPHYLDNYAISSIMYWPPLFDKISMGICVVVYEQSFRVCVVTDNSVTDWPDILLKLYLAGYSELYKTMSI